MDNPVNYTDPSGEFIWDLIDVGFFLASIKQFYDCPSWSHAGWAALDTISLLPVVPSIGYFSHLDDIGKAIQDTRLKNIYNALFQATDTIPGGTAGAVRHFAETGELIGGSTHIKKAEERIKGLNNFLETPGISQGDINIANGLLQQLKDALSLIK